MLPTPVVKGTFQFCRRAYPAPNRTEADLLPSSAHAARRGEQVHPRSLQRLRIAAGTVPVQKPASRLDGRLLLKCEPTYRLSSFVEG